MTRLLVGTTRGVFEVESSGAVHPDFGLEHRHVTALATHDGVPWVLVDGRTLMRRGRGGGWQLLGSSRDHRLTSLLPGASDVLVGAGGAHLLRSARGEFALLESFESVEGRERWRAPDGSPPSVGSIVRDPAGRVHVGVDGGGIVRSRDAGFSWEPTMDPEADVRRVAVHPGRPDLVLAATAWGLGVSESAGDDWRGGDEGLHSPHLASVAAADEAALVVAAEEPPGARSAVYRVPLGRELLFERCAGGLPSWLDGPVAVGGLTACGSDVAVGTHAGTVFVSPDGGGTWTQAAGQLPPVTCLLFEGARSPAVEAEPGAVQQP